MRREIIALFYFFIVLFTSVSLLSYHPGDPSIHNAAGLENIKNVFGILGSHMAGLFIGLFGTGSFWIPILFLLIVIRFLKQRNITTIVKTSIGCLLLIFSTAGLMAFMGNYIILFGNEYSSGGIIGLFINSFLTKYSNPGGAFFILTFIFLAGAIIFVSFSFIDFSEQLRQKWFLFKDNIETWLIKRKEKRQKALKWKGKRKEETSSKEKKITIKAFEPLEVENVPRPKQQVFEFMKEDEGFQCPLPDLLEDGEIKSTAANEENLRMMSKQLEKKLEDFNVKGAVVTVLPGPVITTFEYKPAPGVKINKIVGLSDDLALALRALSIRIVAPIPGKAVIGVEIPNPNSDMVRFKSIVVSKAFEKSKSKLTIGLGKDIVGNTVVSALEKMPHLLIAGATGTGKSVGINSMICSFLYKSTPDEVKMIMIDPKRIELSMYDGIPHLITPVVTDVTKATNALVWAVNEMERRYKLLAEHKARNITQFNNKVEKEKIEEDEKPLEKLPLIVIIIDELADLMMTASRDVEGSLIRLAQMARAAGIHLILATQRPSVDVLTGIIKANFPTRLTFQVSSRTDSRTIIDTNGAENLLGNGDMLLLPPGTAKLQRIHGAYISEGEISRITEFLKEQKTPAYDEKVIQPHQKEAEDTQELEYDAKYDEAISFVTKKKQASISMIQRHLRIGYNRAARIIETMEKEGVIGPSDGAKPREVLARNFDDMP